jgi:hypothetical protein
MPKTLISSVLFVLSAIAAVLSAQENKELAKPALSVSVRSAEPSYSIKKNICLEIQLENVGKEPLLLFRSWGWGVARTNIRVFGVDGKEVVTTFLADQIPPPPTEADFIQLQPNEFFGIRLDESATHFVNAPGSYTVLVEYKSTVSEEWAVKYLRLPQIPLWSMERGTIVSNKVRIDVTK